MPYYPQSAVGLNYTFQPPGPGTTGITLTAGVANTKGSYAEIENSLAFDSNQLYVAIRNTVSNTVLQFLFDIATGAGGAESVIIPNLMAEATLAFSSVSSDGAFYCNAAITSGTRIAGRSQCSVGANTMQIALMFMAVGDTPGISSYVNYGAVTADSGGTSIDPGAVVDTKGAYVELSASTSAVIQQLIFMFTLGGNSAPVTNLWRIDVSIGAGGAEAVVIPDILAVSSGGSADPVMLIRNYTFLTYMAAAVRLACRASSAINNATDRLIDVGIIAGTAPAEPSGGSQHNYAF